MNGAQLHVVMWFLDYSPCRPPIPLSALALGFWNGETFRLGSSSCSSTYTSDGFGQVASFL